MEIAQEEHKSISDIDSNIPITRTELNSMIINEAEKLSELPICLKSKNKCVFLLANRGVTNLLRKQSGMCYTCGKGLFKTTMKLEDLRNNCISYCKDWEASDKLIGIGLPEDLKPTDIFKLIEGYERKEK